MARTLTVTGANGGAELANVTLTGDSAGSPAFSGLTSVDGHLVSGFLTVTGAETANGILSGNNAITSIVGGSGGSFFDLTSLSDTVAAAATINGGTGSPAGNEVDFNNGVLTGSKVFSALSNESIIGDASAAQGGTINWANLGAGMEFDRQLRRVDLQGRVRSNVPIRSPQI